LAQKVLGVLVASVIIFIALGLFGPLSSNPTPSGLGRTPMPKTKLDRGFASQAPALAHVSAQSPWSFTMRALSENPLSLGISFDKPYYTSKDLFATKVSLRNNSTEPLKKAKISLTIRRKIGTKVKIVFRRTWWKALPPGVTTLEIEKKISSLGLKDGTFPVSVTVDRYRVVHLEKKTSLVVVNDRPLPPLNVALVWNLDDPPHFGPNGKLVNRELLKDIRDDPVKSGFHLKSLATLEKYPLIRVNFNFTPLILEEILAVANGRLNKNKKKESTPSLTNEEISARKVLESYANLLQQEKMELIPAPYAYASLAFLGSKKWDKDAIWQIKKGRAVAVKAFDRSIEYNSLYPPGLKLDESSLKILAATNTSYTIIDESYFPKNQRKNIYQPYEIKEGKGKKVIIFYRNSFVSDGLVSESDEEIASQNFIGSLAQIYLTSPVGGRVVVIAPEKKVNLKILEATYKKLEKVPWIKTVTLREAKKAFKPAKTTLVAKKSDTHESGDYQKVLTEARENYYRISAAIEGSFPLKERLLRDLMIAESSHFTEASKSHARDLGQNFLEDVQENIDNEWEKIAFVENNSVTLPSARGKVPIVIQNNGDYTFKFSLSLKGKGLSFPSGHTQEIELKPKENLFTFPVTTGRSASSLTATLHKRGKVIKKVDFMVKQASSAGTRAFFIGVIAMILLSALLIWRYRSQLKA